MTRDEHLKWAKQRAIQYCEIGDISQALASLISDFRSHPELENHCALELGMMEVFSGLIQTPAQMRKFIEGCR